MMIGGLYWVLCAMLSVEAEAGVDRYTYTYSVDNLSLVINESDCDHVCEKQGRLSNYS
jgi:hypothetical protein